MVAPLPNAFITLLTTPSYLPGALVLLHSLIELHPAPRDFKLVCLVTPETVDAKTIGELRRAGFDMVIGVEPIGSGMPGKEALNLMGRPDLNLALTKLHLFRLSPIFSTLIYLDADVLPLRPLDHLFSSTQPHVLSACPDTGWPDCFNSGVMVIRPREEDWTGLKAMLHNGEGEDGIFREGQGNALIGGNGSFDGADQGLLNEYFSEEGPGGSWNRLQFIYNVTPSAAYTWAPAYKRYGHKIYNVHFIGPNKPWTSLSSRPAGMSIPKEKEQSFDYYSLIDRWYDVYDRNVRPTAAHNPDLARRFSVPETIAIWNQAGVQPDDKLDLEDLRAANEKGVTAFKQGQYLSLPLDGRVDLIMPKPKPKQVTFAPSPKLEPTAQSPPPVIAAPLPQTIEQQTTQPSTWDAQRYSPPRDSRPEMETPMAAQYSSAWNEPPAQQASYYKAPDPGPHREPEYPRLPDVVINNDWYGDYSGKVPDRSNLTPVFPWEQPGKSHRRPDRVFPQGDQPITHFSSRQGHSPAHTHANLQPPVQVNVQIPTPEREASPPPPPPQPKSMAEAMASYTNAWDEMPSIRRYVNRMQGISLPPRGQGLNALRSIPPTPTKEKKSFMQRDGSRDHLSEASGDGDDEDDGESSEADPPSMSGSAVVQQVSASERGVAGSSGPGAPSQGHQSSFYRDRHAQTNRTDHASAHFQATEPTARPGATSMAGFGTGGQREIGVGHVPHRAPNYHSRAGSHYYSSGNETARPGYLSSSGGASSQLLSPSPAQAQAQSPETWSGAPDISGKSPLPGSSTAPGFGPPGTTHSRQGSIGSASPGVAAAGQGAPALDLNVPYAGPRTGIESARAWDPMTDIDVRKKDTQEVLSRVVKAGSFDRSGGAGEGGRMV